MSQRLAIIQTIALVAQALALIAGLIFAGYQLVAIKNQTVDQKLIASASLSVNIDKILATSPYADIDGALADKGDTKIWSKPGGKFTEGQVSDYLSWYETIGDLFDQGLLSCDMVYSEFSYAISHAYLNADIQKFISEDRQNDLDTWVHFQSMGKFFTQKPGNPCGRR